VCLAAAAALLDRVGMGKGAAAPAPTVDAPSGEALHARLRRMTDRELGAEIARLEADAARGRVVVYLPAEDEATG
jgi:hypothetical protein